MFRKQCRGSLLCRYSVKDVRCLLTAGGFSERKVKGFIEFGREVTKIKNI